MGQDSEPGSVEYGQGTAMVVGITYISVGVTQDGSEAVRGPDGKLYVLKPL